MPAFQQSSSARAMRGTRACAFVLAAWQLLAAPLAHAQSAASDDRGSIIDLPALEVTSATGIPTPGDEVASSVSVVTAEEIQRKQLRTVPQVLEALPGLNVVQTGGPGGQTSVFIRGTNSNQVKVLIDGIDVGNPSTPNGAFDFGQLLATDLARVEVLRGPQSGLYGADAIGGVISMTTKKGEGPAKVFGFVEGGSFGTFNQAAGLSGSTDKVGYSLNITHFASSDTPVTPGNLVPPGHPRNANAYDNWTYSGRLDFQLSENFTVNVVGRYIDSQFAYTPDTYPAPSYVGIPAAAQSTSFASMFVGKAEGVWSALDGALETTFGASAVTTSNPTVGPNTSVNGEYDGERQVYYLRSRYNFAREQNLLMGVERRNENMTSSTGYTQLEAATGDTAAYAEYQGQFFERLFLAANLRYDSDDTFGDHTTYRIAPAFLIPETGTKLKASYGTGFKAPTLYQLYQPIYGNASLLPEESEGYDAGFEQELWNGRATFGATYFHNDITNLISYDPATYQNININSATTRGVEAFVAVKINDRLKVRADYTYTDAVGYFPLSQASAVSCAPDTLTSCYLLRRPNNKVSLTVNWTPVEKLDLSATLIYVSSWWDVVRFSYGEYTDQPGYTLVNIAANYALNDNATVFGRIDNLFNESYENPNGFLAPGFGAYAGLRVSY